MNQGDVRGLQPVSKHWLSNTCSALHGNGDAELLNLCWWAPSLSQPYPALLNRQTATAPSSVLAAAECWQLEQDGWSPCCAPQDLPPAWGAPLHFRASYPWLGWLVSTPGPTGGERPVQSWLLRPTPSPRAHRSPLAEQPLLLIPSARMGSAAPASQTQRKGISRLLGKHRGAASLSLKTAYKKQSWKRASVDFFSHICYFMQLQGWERKNAELEAKPEHYNVLFEHMSVLLYWNSCLVCLLGFTFF